MSTVKNGFLFATIVLLTVTGQSKAKPATWTAKRYPTTRFAQPLGAGSYVRSTLSPSGRSSD